MVHRPPEIPAFEFVVLSGLRAAQLMRGCIARVESTHKRIETAQIEVATGLVVRAPNLVVIDDAVRRLTRPSEPQSGDNGV